MSTSRRHTIVATWLLLFLAPAAWPQDPPPLELRPRVVPAPVPQLSASCPECQPYADEYNRIARTIDELNFQLAHRRREVDLQLQAIAQVEAQVANLQSVAPSAARDAAMATAQQRLEAYRAQLAAEQAKVAELEARIAASTIALAAARERLQACEKTCAGAAEQLGDTTQPAQSSPAQSSPATPPAGLSPETRYDLRQLRDELTLSEEELERRRAEAERFKENLKAMAGDQWSAELAAFFTSTLFDTETPFETAYVQNLVTLRDINAPTQEEIYAANALARQNARVAVQNADRREAERDAMGQQLEYAYTRDARGLIGPGYPNLFSAGESHKTAALMIQDAHMGQLLQFRAQLNTIRIGDGTVSAGSFVNLSGAEAFVRLSRLNQEIGTLRATGGDEARIAALENERAQLLTFDGLAPSDGLTAARAGLIDGLAGLSADVYEAYWNWVGYREGGVNYEGNVTLDEAAARHQAESARYENIYLAALSRSPFLGAMVDPTGSGDPIPLWKYLTTTESPWSGGHYPSSYRFVATGPRDPAQDQLALTQAIDFVDQATMEVIDRYGTIVTTVPLLDAYGSPVFGPLRAQVISDLSGIYPNITANVALLTSQYEANSAANAFSRTATDVVIGFVQIVVAGVIVAFPITAPALVPLEIALTGGQVGLEGIRLYYAWQDLQRAEQAAAAGAGASYVGVKPYQDLFSAQRTSFIIVAAAAPVATAGSVMSLEAARAELRLAAAVADAPGGAAGAKVGTSSGTGASAGVGGVARSAPDIATFKAMSPDEQVAALKGLPTDVRSQLVSQLDRTGKTLFVMAWEKDAVNAAMIASVRQGDIWLEWVDGRLQPLTDATRNAPDQVILDRLSPYAATRDQLVLSKEAKDAHFANAVGNEVAGPLSNVTPSSRYEGGGEGTFPLPGFYTDKMTEAEINALLAKTGPLTPEEIALKADLLNRGYGRPLAFRPTDGLTQDQIDALMTNADIEALLAKTGPLTPIEQAKKAELLERGFGTGGRVVAPASDTPVAAPAAPPVWNPFNPFAAGTEFDSRVGTLGGAGDSAIDGATSIIPNRPRNPNRTALLDDPDLPPETLILEPFTPPAAGLLDLPTDLRRLLNGEPLPNSFWNVAPPWPLREPRKLEFQPYPAAAPPGSVVTPLPTAPPVTTGVTGAAVPAGSTAAPIPYGTIVHVTQPGAFTTTPALKPFVTKVLPIGCRFAAGSQVPTCDDQATWAVLLNYPPGSTGTIRSALRAMPGFVYGEADEWRFVQASDPYLTSRGTWGQGYDDQWALKQIGLLAARSDSTARRAPVTVAVIDTGVAWNHVDLSPDDLWVNPREIPANARDDDGNGYVDDIVGWNFVDANNLPWDFNGHGTLVAGIIAADRDNGAGIAGVNPDARIMVLKAMDERGRGHASAIAEAIVYAARHGARVVNLSVGGRRLTRTEELAIEFAAARGALVVVAAGNEGIDLADYGPGGARRALTVTATDVSDRRLAATNFGVAIDLAAPGVDVLGPRAIGTDLLAANRVKGYRRGANIVGPDAGYIRATGTSFAAPLVAGVASLLIGANPSLGVADVERILLQSARDIETPGVDRVTGYGRLDAAAALAADPRFFVEAAIDSVAVATTAQGPVARVTGTADAERFAGARIEIGRGETPSSWTRVGSSLSAPVRGSTLIEIPAAAFRDSAVWTLRLVASHANGRTREARFLLTLK